MWHLRPLKTGDNVSGLGISVPSNVMIVSGLGISGHFKMVNCFRVGAIRVKRSGTRRGSLLPDLCLEDCNQIPDLSRGFVRFVSPLSSLLSPSLPSFHPFSSSLPPSPSFLPMPYPSPHWGGGITSYVSQVRLHSWDPCGLLCIGHFLLSALFRVWSVAPGGTSNRTYESRPP